MHFLSFIKSLPLLFSLSTLAAPAPNPEDFSSPDLTNAIFEGPFPINYTFTTDQQPYDPENPPMTISADCRGGGDINTPDIESLFNSLQSRGGDRYLPSTSWVSTTLGSARVCVYNNYIFENTHVSNWEIGWGVRSVREQCCFTPYCGGGTQQGHGDSGLAVNIVTRSAGVAC